MGFNYLKILIRNLWRNKSFSIVSLSSLSIGMACVVIIALFLQTEWSFDKFHKNANRIYRVTTQVKTASTGEIRHYATTMPPIAPSLKAEYDQVEEAIRCRRSDNHIIAYDDKRFNENNVLYVDSGFLKIFSFPLKYGAASTALKSPNSVVLSEAMASKYFGNEDPIGKILKDDSVSWQVTGVMEPIPVSSHLQPDFLVSFDTWKIPVGYPVTLESWTWVTFPTYFLLKEGADVETVKQDMPRFIKKYGGEAVAPLRTFVFQPLTDIYFASELLENATFTTGNKKQSQILTAIAVLILLIGAFNFMTLFSASAVKRTKELGIRKVMGAGRKTLIAQLMGEAVILTMICIPVALVLASVSTGWISAITNFQIQFSYQQLPFAFAVCLCIALLIGLLAGIYPAMQMTAFSPAVTLRNLFSVPAAVSFKKALVITQFSISGILIIASIVMYRQSAYINNKELGFESSDLIRIEMPGHELQNRYSFIKNELLKKPGVDKVTMAGNLFRETIGSVPIYPDAIAERDRAVQMNIQAVHYGFFETFSIELAKGRPVSREFATDSADAIIVNEAAIRSFGWTGDPVGRKLRIGEIKEGVIIGVAKDFHFRTLHIPIGPLVMYIPPTRIENIFIKTEPGKLISTANEIEQSWATMGGNIPLNLSFVDENIGRLYSKDKKFLRLVFLFCGLSIFVACIGLYALTVLITGHRIKEIGVRKVLGAGTASITTLLSKDFVVLVLIAFVIAAPVAWYFLDKWLNEFAYRINMSWWLFVLAAAIVLLIALLTVAVQAIKAAVANPVKSLRTE